MTGTTSAAAIRYHGQGFSVIPILPNSKRPAVPWEVFQRRRPTADELRHWFSCEPRNVAIVCGAVSGGLVVLDIDDPRLAEAVAADVGLQAETTMVRTPRGLHIYSIETNGMSRSGPLLPGVADLKAGDSYILAPPSSINGREYRILTDGPIMRVPDARQWAVGLLAAYGVQVPQESGNGQRLDTAQVLAGVPEGERDKALFRVAAKLRRADVPQDMAEKLVLDAAAKCSPPFPEREALAKVSSAYQRYRPAGTIPDSHPLYSRESGIAVLVPLARVRREKVSWLWGDRIPQGKVSLFDGDPGVGKSWLVLAFAAAVTRGQGLPGEPPAEPGKVLILSAEDGLGDTIRPRLEDMGADLARVHALTAIRTEEKGDRHFSLVEDLARLEGVLADEGYRLVIIDPLNAYLGLTLDSHRDAALRAVLTPLASLAERYRLAIVCIRHLTKGGRDRAIYRGQGSIAYTVAARVVHLVGVNPDNQRERVVIPLKNNLAPLAPALAFELTDGRFTWKGESSMTAAALLAPELGTEERSVLEEGKGFLEELLTDGPVKEELVREGAAASGISKRTLARAKAALGVKSQRVGGIGKDGCWVWVLPKDAKVANIGDLASLGESVSETVPADGNVGILSRHDGHRNEKAQEEVAKWVL